MATAAVPAPKKDASGIPKRTVPMRVVVMGLHRTGSLSTRYALKQLGFNDTYHMANVIGNMETQPPAWERAVEAKYGNKPDRKPFTRDDWDEILGGSQACLDLPAAIFSNELADAYPEAKVVMLNRDPEKWYESVCETVAAGPTESGLLLSRIQIIYITLLDPKSRGFVRFFRTLHRLAMPFDHKKEKAKAIAWFNEQYQSVRDHVPKDRRIEFRVQDGWEPLCAHLGVPVPKVIDEKTGKEVVAPFPRINDRESFKKNADGVLAEGLARANANLFALIGRLTFTAAVGYGGYLGWKTRLGGRF